MILRGNSLSKRLPSALFFALAAITAGLLISCGGSGTGNEGPVKQGPEESSQSAGTEEEKPGNQDAAKEPQPAVVLRSLSLYDKPGEDRTPLTLMRGGETVQWTGRTAEGPDSKGNEVPFYEIKRDDRTGWTFARYLAPRAKQALLLDEAELFSGPDELKFLDEKPLEPRTLVALDPDKSDTAFQHVFWVPQDSWWRREAWIRQDVSRTTETLDIALNLRLEGIMEDKELDRAERLSKLSLLAEKERFQDSPVMAFIRKAMADLEETGNDAGDGAGEDS